MSGSPFDPNRYYRLSYTDNSTLSLGFTNSTLTPLSPVISHIEDYSSENWQIFYDDGVYFIRNHDYELRYQLGVKADNQSTPLMMETGSGLGMQWNITRTGDGSGTWLLSNVLVGPENVLGLSQSASKKQVVVMNTNPEEGKWKIDLTDSPGRATAPMLSPFPSIEVGDYCFSVFTRGLTFDDRAQQNPPPRYQLAIRRHNYRIPLAAVQ